MELDDDDPAWIAACIQAVDSLPGANLPSASRARADANWGKSTSSTSNESSTTSLGQTDRGVANCNSSLYPPGASYRENSRVMNAGGAHVLPQGQTGISPREMAQKPPCAIVRGRSTRGGLWRIHGIGINPEDEVKQSDDEGNIDPCWKCGEAVTLKDHGGGSRHYGCSSHPLCKATRKTRKVGAVIELQAEEMRSGSTSSDPVPVGNSFSDVTRCHLVVSIHGGHDGGAAQAAWNFLKRNGIVPARDPGHTGLGDENDCGGNHNHTGYNGVIRDAKPKAVLPLGRRDAVRRLVKQEGLAYRDVPQATYSRLVRLEGELCARGERKVYPGGNGLEPLEVCEALMYKLPGVLRETLLPFQRDGVLYGLRRRGRCLIADEMGTGKTLQALGVLGCYREDWPLLIVAPASMRLMWAEEVEHWYPFLSPEEIHLIKGSKDKLYLTKLSKFLWPRVVIVSYFMLGRLAENIGKDDWKAVIFDESHTISTKLGDGSTQAKQTTVCLGIAKRAERVAMLSGTPSLSKPFDLFNQVEALAPGLLGGKEPLFKAKHNFVANYCGGTMRRQQARDGSVNRVPFISGCDYPDELHVLLKNEVMIRRLKKNVVDQLPPLRRTVVRVAAHMEDLKAALEAGGFEPDPEGDDEEENNEGGSIRQTRWAGGLSDDQRAGLKKVKSASQWVVDKLAASQETRTKFVVFAHHRTVLDRLQEAFELAGSLHEGTTSNEGDDVYGEGFTCLRIDGEVPTAVRASRLIKFNTDTRCRVLLVSITAGGQGLDFTAASNVVFVELPESPTWLRQAEDRLHRRKQEKSVNVYLMVLPAGSYDDVRWLRLSEKLTTQTSVMNGVAHAENIKVDRVCDADAVLSMLTMDSGGSGGAEGDKDMPRCRRHRRFRMHSAMDEESDNSTDCDSSDVDGCLSNKAGKDERDDKELLETSLDEEMREALVFTPADPNPSPNPRSPMLRLLQAIADSPAHSSKSAATADPTGIGKGLALAKTGDCGRRRRMDSSAVCGARYAKGLSSTPDNRGRNRSRKRPRCSPNSADATGRRRNPFKAFRHPSPSFSPSPILSLEDGRRRKQGNEGPKGTGWGEAFSQQALTVEGECALGIDLSGDVDVNDTAGMIRTPRAKGAMGSPRTPKASQDGDGSASSPLVLVDACSAGEEGSDVDPTLGGDGGRVERAGCPSLSQRVHNKEHEEVGVYGSRGSSAFGRGLGEAEERGKNEKHEEQAKRLLFLVSPNTGRVHVYEERGTDADSDDDFDEGNKPRHCRCNFRAEDLDRLFEAAKQASLIALSAPAEDTRSTNHCQAEAKEALDKLPNVLKSAAALRVARAFVQEWRALSSRKRPLLNDTPSRPPLAAKVAELTSRLTGSTQRYRHPVAADGDGRDTAGMLMCSYCEKKPASSQGKPVHRRDRFCSVKCMEAESSRRSGASLRRLVCERDHGVCAEETCKRDCLALVSRLKAIQDHQKRREVLLRADSRFGDERGRKLRERLVLDPIAGHAWHADHVTAVYEGGGECDIDNLRTLCVVCHAEVTRKQTAKRAAARKISKENQRRSLEETQGQRRLVSFGGVISLSQPSPTSSNRKREGHDGAGGGSAGEAFELDSDDIVLVPLARDDSGKADVLSPILSSASKPSSSSAPVSTAGCKKSSSLPGRAESGRSSGQTSRGCTDLSHDVKSRERGTMRPSLEAFERLMSGEDFCVDLPSPRGKARPVSSSSIGDKGGPVGDENGVGGPLIRNGRSNGGGDGSGEMSFTRVRRIRRPLNEGDKTPL